MSRCDANSGISLTKRDFHLKNGNHALQMGISDCISSHKNQMSSALNIDVIKLSHLIDWIYDM